MIDPVSGPAPYPNSGFGAQGAVKYVNTLLHGVAGRPVSLVICQTDGTPETNVNCANSFVQAGVVAVVNGYEAGAGAELPVLHSAGIPLVGQIAKDATSDHDPKSYFFGPPDAAFAVGPLQLMAQKHLKNVAFGAINIPSYHAYFNTDILPAAARLGLSASVSYYDPSNPNWSVVAATLASKQAQISGLVAAPQSDCTSLLGALKTVGYAGQILLGACSDFISAAGPSKAAGVWSYTGNWLPSMANHAPGLARHQIQIYEAAMKAIGKPNITDEQASGTFAAVVDLAEIMNTIKGKIDGATVNAALAGTKNFQSFLGPKITCSHQEWPGTSSCSNEVLVTIVGSDGKFAPGTTANGGFTKPDTSLIH
jgi:branched-chain amino acid transport system substrate-binding protein